MSEAWDIDWYICTADAADVEYARGKPEPDLKLRVGGELWRAARSIGPLVIDHSHWAGNHLDCTEKQARVAAAAPAMLALLRRVITSQQRGGEDVDFRDAAFERLAALISTQAFLTGMEDIKEEDL